ncbi:unnamed protein product [Candidula unifasciata]|uniref:Methyltransferase FkbM domain-containing protein n=1 Tax=Candidula unifasciata TaxID=100452 RepID=A0A8S3ZT87_9EUPU|nr:unnamed protein product [Candidula unifasciata]
MIKQRIFGGIRSITKGHLVRCFCLAVATLAIIEFLVLNIFVISLYRVISRELSEISSSHERASFLDKLQNNKKINNFLADAKADGLFLSLLQETVERLYIVHNFEENNSSRKKSLRDMKGRQMKRLSFIGVDVSHSKEATYIYNRIMTKSKFPYHFMIVDIGANDGFISSNSFNFIQWGWDAVLVEPQPLELHIAERNIKMYVDRYNDGDQMVKYVQSAIGSTDGSVDFVITKNTMGAESHIKSQRRINEGDVIVPMPVMTVKTLVAEVAVPKNFGILSIDAEGSGYEILKQWIALNFRPAYIIYEHLHAQEPKSAVADYLKENGYHYLGTLGWNMIFEHSELAES